MYLQYRILLTGTGLDLLSYQKTMGRNSVGDFISDDFQSLSFRDRMQSDVQPKAK